MLIEGIENVTGLQTNNHKLYHINKYFPSLAFDHGSVVQHNNDVLDSSYPCKQYHYTLPSLHLLELLPLEQ